MPGDGVSGYSLTTIPNSGLAATPMTIEANVDAPAQLIDPSNGWQYYRIRATGTMPLTARHAWPIRKRTRGCGD